MPSSRADECHLGYDVKYPSGERRVSLRGQRVRHGGSGWGSADRQPGVSARTRRRSAAIESLEPAGGGEPVARGDVVWPGPLPFVGTRADVVDEL